MPIENITKSQRQGQLFGYTLTEELNPNNKLYKLRSLIDWSNLASWLSANINISQLGRNRRCHRVLLGVSMLQAMYNLSDAAAEEEIRENVYWQYFCGWEYLTRDTGVSEAGIRRFRKSLGEDGYNEILKELMRVGGKVGILKRKDLESIIVDSTVQIKNIKYPHDVYLMDKARVEVVKLCHDLDIQLNETYAKTYKRDMLKLWKYRDGSKATKRKSILQHLKILLGRLIRICERSIANRQLELSANRQEVLSKIKKIHAQSILNRIEKEKYKEDDKVLYSFHAPEVECIGKGKLNKPYEFGNKVSIAVSGGGNFVLTAKSFHGNPYDGHTLAQTSGSVTKLTEVEIKKMFVDLGYKGSNVKEKAKVYSTLTKKKLSLADKAMIKRRSSIEPIIGHLKNFGRMGII